VGWLNGTIAMPPDLKAAMDAAGLTQNDYKEMLELHPYGAGDKQLDPDRFVFTGDYFSYAPPLLPDDDQNEESLELDNEYLTTVKTGFELSTSVGFSAGVEGGFGKLLESKFEVAKTWTWTLDADISLANAKTQSASVTIGQPASGWAGPTIVEVWFADRYGRYRFPGRPGRNMEVKVKGVGKKKLAMSKPIYDFILPDNVKLKNR
jgi:hypothetical protein